MKKGVSRAKINLFLHITGKREDGYHNISSFMAFLDSLYDEIHIEKDESRSITFFKKAVPEVNTISKALDLLPEYDTNFKIKVYKAIPIASGMGGGSVNAAFILNFMKNLYNIPEEVIYEVGLKVGSDLPICIKDKACMVSGIGEKLDIINANIRIPAVVINNGIKLSSKNMYALYDYQSKIPSQNVSKDAFEYNSENFVNHLSNLGNDLQFSAIATVPEIRLLLDEILATSGCIFSRMSGSGPTCFGVFGTEFDAFNAAKYLQNKYPHYLVKFCHIIN